MRSKRIFIRVSDEEKAEIAESADGCSMSSGAYLRALGIGHQVKSTLDQQMILKILRINADQARLGGLLKLWLSGTEKSTEGMSLEIRDLLRKIEDTQKELKECVRSLK